MTRGEFDKLGAERGFDFEGKITDSDYKTIEYVYMFHPAIDECDGKKQIVDLVGNFGMRIVFDMFPTARKAKSIEAAIASTREQLDKLKEQLEDLKEGRE